MGRVRSEDVLIEMERCVSWRFRVESIYVHKHFSVTLDKMHIHAAMTTSKKKRAPCSYSKTLDLDKLSVYYHAETQICY